MKNKLLIIPILALLLLANACKDTEDIIPTYRFSRQIDYIEQYIPKNKDEINPYVVERNWNGQIIGNAGVVIYIGIPGEEYYVFDLMCPYEKNVGSLVEIGIDGFCVCPTCDSKFAVSIAGGALINGPSKHPLYSYRTEVHNGTLYISN